MTTTHPPATTTIAPLRHVTHTTVSELSGTALNPHYFWMVHEYTLLLDCGHRHVRTRCAYHGRAPEQLTPPLPTRVRCPDCPPVTSISKPRKPSPPPTFDSVMGTLVAAMCTAVPAQQDFLLDWADLHGRYVPDSARRDRAYGAVALRMIDIYLPDTRNSYAPPVRTAVERWSRDPSHENRLAVRGATRRLYNAQLRDGGWYAHRGIIDAAKITSPHPHNVQAIVDAPTWDNPTRSTFYHKLWAIRKTHDRTTTRADGEMLDGREDTSRYGHAVATQLAMELHHAVNTGQPTLGEQHMDCVKSMLTAYQCALHE